MRAIPTVLSLPGAMKVIAILPVLVALIMWRGQNAQVRDPHCYGMLIEASCGFATNFYYMGSKTQETDLALIFKAEEEVDDRLDLSMLSLSEAKRLMDVEGEMPANRQDNSPHTSIEHRGNSNGQLVARISAYATAHDQAAWVEAIKAFGIRRGCERILILGNHEVGVFVLYDSAYVSESE